MSSTISLWVKEEANSIAYSKKLLDAFRKNLMLDDYKFTNMCELLKINSREVLNNYDKFNSFLLYGDVQSGKTNNLINIVVNLFELNKVDVIFYFTGNQNELLTQNQSRFIKTLKEISSNFLIYKNEELDVLEIESAIRKEKKIVINSLKINYRLEQVKKLCEDFSKNIDILIIDDEGDTLSLSNKSLNIFSSLKFRDGLKFISITASPFLNLYKNHGNYDYYQVLRPFPEYCGLQKFHDNFIILDSEDDFTCYEAILKGFFEWLGAVCKYKLKKSQFLVNIFNKNKKQEEIWDILYKNIFQSLKISKPKLDYNLKKYSPHFYQYFNEISDLLHSLEYKNFVIWNSTSMDELHNSDYEIILGGFKLSRGITFEYLTTEIMLNMTQSSINAGTLIQRARWLGYRHNSLEQIKIIVNTRIANAFKEIEDLVTWTKDYHLGYNKYKEIFDDNKYKYINLPK